MCPPIETRMKEGALSTNKLTGKIWGKKLKKTGWQGFVGPELAMRNPGRVSFSTTWFLEHCQGALLSTEPRSSGFLLVWPPKPRHTHTYIHTLTYIFHTDMAHRMENVPGVCWWHHKSLL